MLGLEEAADATLRICRERDTCVEALNLTEFPLVVVTFERGPEAVWKLRTNQPPPVVRYRFSTVLGREGFADQPIALVGAMPTWRPTLQSYKV